MASLTRKLAIDADPGIVDALALALALHDPDFEVLCLTAVGGRVSGDQATRNILAILAHLDPPRWPRLGFSEDPLPSLPDNMIGPLSEQLNGVTGLGELPIPDAVLHQHHDSAKVLIEAVKTHPHEVTLLTLGPLTNVARAQELYPPFLEQLKEIVCLGGSVAVGGDITAAAEFNIHAGPEVARNVLGSPVTRTIVPLDASRKVVLSFEQYDRLKFNRLSRMGRFLEQTIPFALRSHRQYLGHEGITLDDVVALAAIREPRWFSSETYSMDVEVSGEITRGATVFDRRYEARWRANVEVLVDVDVQGVLDFVTSALSRIAPE